MYLLFMKDISLDYFLLAVFCSVLPDLDIFISPLKRVFKSNYLEHRGGSHSYVTGIVISFIVGIIHSTFTKEFFVVSWIIGMVFYGLHVSMDLLTTTKIPCFFPISKKEYSFYIEKAGSGFTMLSSIAFLVLSGLIFFFTRSMTIIIVIIDTFTYFFIFYYAYRIFSKIWFNSNRKDSQKYLPGILPFHYFVYSQEIVNNEISLNIEKKSHFSKPKTIENNATTLNSEEMVFYKLGTELYKSDYYFAKWTVFPMFIRNEDIFSIRFFFLETMMKNRTMYIEFNFNRLTQTLISYSRGSASIQSH